MCFVVASTRGSWRFLNHGSAAITSRSDRSASLPHKMQHLRTMVRFAPAAGRVPSFILHGGGLGAPGGIRTAMPKQFHCRTSYDTNLITGNERSPLAHLQRKTAFWLFAPVHRANFERQERAGSAPTRCALGTTGVRAKAAIRSRARNGLHRPKRAFPFHGA